MQRGVVWVWPISGGDGDVALEAERRKDEGGVLCWSVGCLRTRCGRTVQWEVVRGRTVVRPTFLCVAVGSRRRAGRGRGAMTQRERDQLADERKETQCLLSVAAGHGRPLPGSTTKK